MYASGPPRLYIDPRDIESNQQSATSPAGPYFSSPASYNPLPFTQQSNLGNTFGGGTGVQDYFPSGRGNDAYPATSPRNGGGGGGTMMGLGFSQISETPSMLRSSSSSSYSSTSSFVPSTPLNMTYFSPSPTSQASPCLFSPPLASSHSFSNHTTPTNRIAPSHPREQSHAHGSSYISVPPSDSGIRRHKGNSSISYQHNREIAQPRIVRQGHRSRNESINKLPTPIGIGTRPDEEVKKRKKILVRIPKEQQDENLLDEAAEEDEEEKDEKIEKPSRMARNPLSSEEKQRMMDRMERDLAQGTTLEEDELVGKPLHFDEIKVGGLPPTIDVYLPGLSGWEVAWEEFRQDSISRFGSFDVKKPDYFARSPPSSLTPSLSPTSPRPPLSPIPPPAPVRSHTRSYSLFNSPVALPARLQNVLDSLSLRTTPRHSSTMSLSTSPALNPTASPFSPTQITTETKPQTKLTPFAPSFSMPSWSTIKAKAQGIPLPETDESMEEETETEAPTETILQQKEVEADALAMETIKDEVEGFAGSGEPSEKTTSESHRELSSIVEADQGMARGEEVTGPLPTEKEEEDMKLSDSLQSRKMSTVSNRTDHTGIASISDGFSAHDEPSLPASRSQISTPVLVESPQSLHSPSPSRFLLQRASEAVASFASLPPLPPSLDGSDTETEARQIDTHHDEIPPVETSEVETAIEEPSSLQGEVGVNEINQSFEFPSRSPEKPPTSSVANVVEHYNSPSKSSEESPQIGNAIIEAVSLDIDEGSGQTPPEISPTLFGANGGPGSISVSSTPSSPTPVERLAGSQLASPPQPTSSAEKGRQNHTMPRYPLPPTRESIVCPIPRRPYPAMNSTFDENDFESAEASAPTHSSQFEAPALPPSLLEQAPTPRKISHGPLPPIPLVQVETNNIYSKSETRENGSSSSILPHDCPSYSATSPEDPDYIPSSTQFVPVSLQDHYVGRRGRKESEDIALPSSSRPKHRALPVPPSSENPDRGYEVERVSEHETEDAASLLDRNSIKSPYSTRSGEEDFEADDDDTPLRILERIIDRQFEGLRNELRSMVSISDTPARQERLLKGLTEKLQHLLSPATPRQPGQLSLESLQRYPPPALAPQTAVSYSIFLEDLRATVQPLIQAPFDTDKLAARVASHLHTEMRSSSPSSDSFINLIDKSLRSTFSDTLGRSNASKSFEDLEAQLSNLLDAQNHLAATLTHSNDAASTLKDLMAQLGLDVTSRLDSAYKALEERFATDASSPLLVRIGSLESQLEEVRQKRDNLHQDQAALTNRHEAERNEQTLEVRRLENELAASQAALEVVKAGNGERIQELTSDLTNARVDSETLKKELSTLQEEKEKEGLLMIELERNLAGQTSETAALRQELEAGKARESRMRDLGVTEMEKKDAELRSLKQKLDMARGGILVLEKRLALQDERLEGYLIAKSTLSNLDERKQQQDSPLPSPTGSQPFVPLSEMPPTPPSKLFANRFALSSIASELEPQHTGGSDDSDGTIAHTSFSPAPSVTSHFSVSEDGWYSVA